MVLLTLCSCDNSTRLDSVESEDMISVSDSLLNLKSGMESSTYNIYSAKLSNLINAINTRATEEISDSAEIYLKPFVLDGKSIQKSILVKLDNNSQDYKYFQEMSDEQLASLSF